MMPYELRGSNHRNLIPVLFIAILAGYSPEQIAEEWARRAEFDRRDDITPQEMLDEVVRRAKMGF